MIFISSLEFNVIALNDYSIFLTQYFNLLKLLVLFCFFKNPKSVESTFDSDISNKLTIEAILFNKNKLIAILIISWLIS